jgi:hypothetical protein
VAQDPFRSGFDIRRFIEQEVYTLRNREVRFPDSTRTVDHSWTGGMNPEFRGFGVRSFVIQEFHAP